MESNQYKIIAKEFKGIDIAGVVVENSEGNRKNISISDATKLARNNQIVNATAKLDVISSEYVIDIEGGIKNLDTIDRSKGLHFTLLCRLLNSDGKCVGYRAQDDKGKKYKFSISKVWEFAQQGAVQGIKAKISSKGKILESTEECDLYKLPVLRS